MLLSVRNRRKARIAVALFALSMQSSALAVGPDEWLPRAKQLIRKLYVALDPRLHAVIVDERPLSENDVSTPWMELWDVEHGTPTTGSCSNFALSGTFVFDWQSPKKELMILAVGGPAVTGRRDTFAAEMNKHPDWSEAKIIEAMHAAGAKYGPDQKAELLRELPLETLKPFVGGEITVESADFSVREIQSRSTLSWVVKAKWHGCNGQEADCMRALEPFDGNLESFERYSWSTGAKK